MPQSHTRPKPQARVSFDAPAYIDHMPEPATVKVSSLKSRWEAMATAYAYHNETLLALSMVGPGTALDAIRANIVMGRRLAIHIKLAEPRHVRTSHFTTGYYETHDAIGLDTAGQRYALYKTRLLGRDDHYLLINRRVIEPRHDDDPIYIICPLKEPEAQSIGRGLEQALNIPVLPEWYEYLAHVNASATTYAERTITRVPGEGFNILSIKRAGSWQQVISDGLSKGLLAFPGFPPAPPVGKYPAAIDNRTRCILYNLLNDEALTLAVDAVMQDGWRDNLVKERNIKAAIQQLAGDASATEKIFGLIKATEGL